MSDPTVPDPAPPRPRRVVLMGASGTIGRATLRMLLLRGHDVTCLMRRAEHEDPRRGVPEAAELRLGNLSDPDWLARVGLAGTHDVLVSCMASRTGAPADAWAVDYRAHSAALAAARAAGVGQMVLLSAICVQKPLLAFQKAKLAFEHELAASGLQYSIVRPTAFFKSLSGQVERVRAGKPFLLFGDGCLTACKPISDADLARYMAACVEDPARMTGILPVGGPGPALTPRAQGEMLFELAGRPPRFRQLPVALLDGIIATLSAIGRVAPRLRDKAELARIGRYYATESMLLLDPLTGRYDADATPVFGTDTLREHYAAMLRGETGDDRGAHAVF